MVSPSLLAALRLIASSSLVGRSTGRRAPELGTNLGTNSGSLLNQLIRSEEERLRDREAERLGGLEVDEQMDLGRLLDRQVGGLGAIEVLVRIGGGPTKVSGNVRPVRYAAACLGERLSGQIRLTAHSFTPSPIAIPRCTMDT